MTNSQRWQEFRYSSNDNLELAGRKYGWQHRDKTPVLCLPGLTRNSEDFHELAMYLSTHEKHPRRVLCLDFRGRGSSAYDDNWSNYNPLVEATDVIDGVIAAGLAHVALVGTSRGGLIAMVLAAMRPGMMKSVIFNDIGPEVDGPGLVRIKNQIENAVTPRNWDEAIKLMANATSRHFTKWDARELERQTHLVFKEQDGKLVHRYDEGLIKAMRSINLDQPLPTFWPQFEGLRKLPMLLIRGENSDLLSIETVEKMKKIHPEMELLTVPHQGHAPDMGSAEIPQTVGKFLLAAERNS